MIIDFYIKIDVKVIIFEQFLFFLKISIMVDDFLLKKH